MTKEEIPNKKEMDKAAANLENLVVWYKNGACHEASRVR
jgi:hypothetical protein